MVRADSSHDQLESKNGKRKPEENRLIIDTSGDLATQASRYRSLLPFPITRNDHPGCISSGIQLVYLDLQQGAAARLPQEIIDIIINHSHNDKSALSVLALVSWSWLPSARCHLFARVELRELYEAADGAIPFDPFWRFHSGLEILMRSPAIASCIRFVQIRVNHDQYLVTQGFQFLSLLPNLCALSLMNIAWLNLNPGNVPTILTGITTVAPTLEELSLTTVTFADTADVALFVRTFLKVKRLSFSTCEWDAEWKAPTMTPIFAFCGLPEPPVQAVICLEYISIHDCPPQAILEILLQRNTFKLNSLKGVKFHWEEEHLMDFATYAKFFRVVGNNLQTIILGVHVMDSHNPYDILQLLSRCRRLSSFSINTCYRRRYKHLVWFGPILEAVATSTLEEFTIHCILYWMRNRNQYIPWAQIDDTLSDAARVPLFRTLNVVTGLQETEPLWRGVVHCTCRDYMPRLLYAGKPRVRGDEVDAISGD
ncbi:hypothetical protein CPB85DRAFT_1255442 [Mucidula mucida]|nr:hypothetical protein CPB85DRAFT_1255442 [Mucidula mucida]